MLLDCDKEIANGDDVRLRSIPRQALLTAHEKKMEMQKRIEL